MLVKDLTKSFLRIDCKKTISEAADLLEKNHTASALIDCNGKPAGVVTERDFLKKVVAKGLDTRETAVQEIMSKPIITISEDASIFEAAELMDKNDIRRLAVINASKEIIGKITTKRISKNIRFIRAMKAKDFSRKFHGSGFA